MRTIAKINWTPTLLDVKSISACGNSISRFELDIEGGKDLLKLQNFKYENVDIEFDLRGSMFRCTIQLE
jgi:hypothetical protein